MSGRVVLGLWVNNSRIESASEIQGQIPGGKTANKRLDFAESSSFIILF